MVGFCSSSSTSMTPPRGVIDGDVNFLVADFVRAPLLAVTGDPVAHLAKVGQSLYVDVNQIASPSHSYRCTGGLDSRFRNRARPE
jgi:hypothetical protein